MWSKSSKKPVASHEEQDIQVQFTDADLEDPSLLAELQNLMESSSPSTTKARKPVSTEDMPHTNINNIHIEEDVKVEFDEQDMQDPQLLDALAQIMNDAPPQHLHQQVSSKKEEKEEEDLSKELNSLKLEDAPKILSIDTNLLEKLEKSEALYKKMAIKYKKNQQLQKAREMLVESKRIHQQIDRVSTGLQVSPQFEFPLDPIYEELNPVASTPTPETVVLKELPPKPKSTPLVATPYASTKTSNPSIPSPIIPITTNDNREEQELSLADIHETFETSNPKDIFTHLIDSLQSQIESCVKIASFYFQGGQKDKALEFHKLKKAYLMDLETLKALSMTPGSHPPRFKHVPISYDYQVSFPELSATELELVIESVDKTDMIPSTDGMMASIAFDMDGVSDVPNSPLGKGETLAFPIKSLIEYSHSKKIPITRNKLFQRFLERKKATFELIFHSTSFVFITKKTIVAKAQVKLDSLLTRCEIQETLSLMDPSNPRKAIGPKLKVIIRLRSPLLKPENVSKHERWFQIEFDKHPEPSTGSVVVEPVKNVKEDMIPPKTPPKELQESTLHEVEPVQGQVESVVLETQANLGPEIPIKEKIATQSKESIQQQDEEDLEELILNFKSPDNIISNQVLEREHSLLSRQLEQIKLSKKPIPDDLIDQKNAYEIRMNLLISLVQMGKLTMSDYISKVEASITETRKLALKFKRGGKVEIAQQCLVRVKLMEEEVKEVKNAELE